MIMCTNQYKIYPPHSKRPLFVKCGKCPSCLQEKASLRVSRIKNTRKDGYVCLMVTLTYSQHTAPYVDRTEAYDFLNGDISTLNIYRDCSVRKVRRPSDSNDYTQVYDFKYRRVVLDTIDFDLLEYDHRINLFNTKDLKHEFGKIGICYYKDYQHFIARLRLNLKRHYGFEEKFFVYACSEYGSKSQRPHFHLLVFIPEFAETLFRAAIIESWPFSNLARFKRAIERSYEGASYVASYVNKPSNFPKFLSHFFKDKHSYSKGFGLSNKNFSLSEILSKVERGFIKYNILTTKNNIPVVRSVPIPSYVINRYFPKFKGYTIITPCSLLSNMLRIVRGQWHEFDKVLVSRDLFKVVFYHIDGSVYLTPDELYKIRVRLLNAFERYKLFAPDGYGLTIEEYLRLHVRVWSCFNSSVLRLHLQNPDVSVYEKYDNWDDVLNDGIPVYGINLDGIVTTDPNQYSSIVRRTAKFTSSFHDTIKHRSVANSVYLLNDDCEL